MTMEGVFPNAAVCPSCSSPARLGETFCGVCGARVAPAPVAAVTTLPSAIVPQADTLVTKPKNRSPLIGAIAGAVVVVVAVALLGVNDAGAHSQLTKTRGNLASTQSTLTATKADLGSTQQHLSTTQQRLNSTKADLVVANATKARVHAALVSTQQELSGVRGNLTSTQNQLNLQSGQMAILKTCLSGVATAFSADLNGDYSAALAALNSVESACQQASDLLG
jgi:hypothetical protein